ncbi:MAG: hypothetical protein EOP04_02620 [Proteobacteria bacterium]|nr:MAG: hypothetical protein EOP04_02620 [Pseudomonadota bacterium]
MNHSMNLEEQLEAFAELLIDAVLQEHACTQGWSAPQSASTTALRILPFPCACTPGRSVSGKANAQGGSAH